MADTIDKEFGKQVQAPGTSQQRNYDGKTQKEPTKPDETQDTEVKREITVVFNNKRYAMVCDDNGCSWVDKGPGNGITISKNGDIVMVSGGGGNGKTCGGRLLINAKGGQMIKSGPIVTEASAKSTSATNAGEGGQTTESSAKDKVACSNVYYGDSITECHGEVRIKGTNIVLEAADVLTLQAKSKIIIQAGPNGGGALQLNAGKITSVTDNVESIITGQKTEISSETTDIQFDPRATKNIVSAGHINWKILGDYQQTIAGVSNTIVAGGVIAPPLVVDRTSSYKVLTTAAGVSLTSASLFNITAVGPLTQASNATTITSTTFLNMIAGTGASILTGTGNVDLTATAGNINVKGLMIYLN